MNLLPTLADIEAAAQVVYREFPPTPQYRWALLSQRLGADCWVKHENHTPVGAFKIRGGLTFFDALARRGQLPREVVSATRGNHGQSIGWAARAHGVACTIVVPRGNSVEKNAAMRALGVNLIDHGDDFTEASDHAARLAEQRGALRVPSFHPDLVSGVATYWWELLRAVPRLDVVYVPIGLGSGACAAIAAKAALNHPARVVGVVSRHATTYADSLAAGHVVEAPVSPSWPTAWPCAAPTPPRWPPWPGGWTTWCKSATTKWPAPCARSTPIRTTPPKAPARPLWPPPCKSARRCAGSALASRSRAPTSMHRCWLVCCKKHS